MPEWLRPRLTYDISWKQLLSAAFGNERRHSLPVHKFNRHWTCGLSVRTLFDAILSELALPEGTPFVCTGINILGMWNIIRAHGLEPIVIDIDPETLLPAPGVLTQACADSGARHCLIAHLYGAYSELSELNALRNAGITVISDLAQAFDGMGSLSLDPHADITLFSFGPIKRKTALGGALAGFHSADMQKRVERRLSDYPSKSDFWFRRRALKYLIFKAFTFPYLFALIEASCSVFGGDFDALIGRSSRGFGDAGGAPRFRYQPPQRLLALLTERLSEPPTGQMRKDAVRSVLTDLPACLSPIGHAAQRHSHWVVPVMSDLDPEQYISNLRKLGFDATRGSTSLICLAPSQAPIAQRIIHSVVYVPHPINLSELDRRKLSERLVKVSAQLKEM